MQPAGQNVEALAVETQEQNCASRLDFRTLSASDWRVLHGRFAPGLMLPSHNFQVQVVEKKGPLTSRHDFRTLGAPDWGTIYGRFKLAAVPPAGQHVEAGAVEQQEQNPSASKHSFRTLCASEWGLVHGRFKVASAPPADQSLDVHLAERAGKQNLDLLTSAPPAVQGVEVQAVDAQPQDCPSRYNLRNFRKPNWEKARDKFKAVSMWKRTDRTLR